MASSSSSPWARLRASSLADFSRALYKPTGFRKGYNFVLWFIFAGAMMGFCLARFSFIDFQGVYCSLSSTSPLNHAAPGECWRYGTRDVYRIGIKMHLFTIIPAGFLVCFQFVPVIRFKAILFHRMNGYIILSLSLVGTVGALMIARVAFGGGIDAQAAIGVMSVMFLASLGLSVYNIKRLQIEQHRAWMLRAWFYAGCIITTRIVMVAAANIMSRQTMGPYFKATSCDEIASFYNDTSRLLKMYPQCQSMSSWVPVRADFTSAGRSAESTGAALDLSSGMAFWLSLALHAVGVEVYLHLTPAEANRLRNVSFQRQLEAGSERQGRAGLTADSVRDAVRWLPEAESKTAEEVNDAATTGVREAERSAK